MRGPGVVACALARFFFRAARASAFGARTRLPMVATVPTAVEPSARRRNYATSYGEVVLNRLDARPPPLASGETRDAVASPSAMRPAASSSPPATLPSRRIASSTVQTALVHALPPETAPIAAAPPPPVGAVARLARATSGWGRRAVYGTLAAAYVLAIAVLVVGWPTASAALVLVDVEAGATVPLAVVALLPLCTGLVGTLGLTTAPDAWYQRYYVDRCIDPVRSLDALLGLPCHVLLGICVPGVTRSSELVLLSAVAADLVLHGMYHDVHNRPEVEAAVVDTIGAARAWCVPSRTRRLVPLASSAVAVAALAYVYAVYPGSTMLAWVRLTVLAYGAFVGTLLGWLVLGGTPRAFARVAMAVHTVTLAARLAVVILVWPTLST